MKSEMRLVRFGRWRTFTRRSEARSSRRRRSWRIGRRRCRPSFSGSRTILPRGTTPMTMGGPPDKVCPRPAGRSRRPAAQKPLLTLLLQQLARLRRSTAAASPLHHPSTAATPGTAPSSSCKRTNSSSLCGWNSQRRRSSSSNPRTKAADGFRKSNVCSWKRARQRELPVAPPGEDPQG